MSRRDEYVKGMEEALALWSARFDALKVKAGKDAKAEIAKQLERWSEAREAAAAKLAELKAAVEDKWDLLKVEMDKAWHAIEKMLDEGVPRAVHITKEEMQGLSPEQQDAILEALVIAVVADGKIGAEEVARFNVEIGKVPWMQPKEEILKKAQAAQARVLALANIDERRAMLQGIAARLPHGPISEKTLAMMALIMAADNDVNELEKGTLTTFAAAFGIPKERLQVIARSLRAAA